MNIEETQKINELAKELQSHGMAANSEEATKKAEAIITGSVSTTPEPEAAPESELNQLKSSVAYLQADLKNLVTEMQKLVTIYSGLKQEVAELKRGQQTTPTPAHVEVQQEISQAEAPKEKSKDETGFNTEDVAVDKVFYFGKK